MSTGVAFLLMSNQQLLQYLNSIQLRFLFAMIMGICLGTAMHFWDLNDPFRGPFSIETTNTQLEDLKVCLREYVRIALPENGEVSSSTRKL